jgi:hypothetical protein
VSPAQYRKLLVDARTNQLELTAQTIARIDGLLLRAYRHLDRLYAGLPDDKSLTAEERWLRGEYIRDRQHELKKLMRNLHSDYSEILGAGLQELGEAGVARERAVRELLSLPEEPRMRAMLSRRHELSGQLSNGTVIDVDFSQVALDAVDNVMKRVYRDGLSLSGRIWNLSNGGQQELENRLLNALLTGQSAQDLSESLKHFLTESGKENLRYNAMRLARTEINNAYREASIQAATDPETGKLHPWLAGIRWSLSASHTQIDICDVWASDDTGLGSGIYAPDDIPPGHPHCMCWTADVLRDYPDVSLSPVQPKIDEVPPGQIEYYANQGDAPATRLRDAQRAAPARPNALDEGA